MHGIVTLNQEESRRFSHAITHPDHESIRRRDDFIKTYGGTDEDYHDDGSMSFTVPGITLDTIKGEKK